ncbi:MAG: nucleotidyltransferase family protein [Gammaproteobacteria bacterium]|nr:nucleotidyltransferase family protein [Gammaproteobacteria bacterium]
MIIRTARTIKHLPTGKELTGHFVNPAEIERFLGHCIAASITDDEAIGEALEVLRSGRVPWQQVAETANKALITPALRGFLCNSPASNLVPAIVRHHVDGANIVSARRNRALWNETCELVGHLNGVGVKPVLLKGLANFAAGLYPDPGCRMMCDVDLLVPGHLMEACANILIDAGYTESQAIEDHHHHPVLHRPGQEAHFELHSEPVADRNRAQALLGSTELLKQATPCSDGFFNYAIPPAELRVVHAIVHDQLADRGFPRGKRSLRSLYDVALLVTRHPEEVSWTRLQNHFTRLGRGHVIDAFAMALEDTLGWQPPGEMSGFSLKARMGHRKWLLQRRIPLVNRVVLRLHRIGLMGLINPKRWAGYLSRRLRRLINIT